MPLRLASVLSRSDFATPELGALVLDGEAYRVDDCVAPLDEIVGPTLRAAALATQLPARLIAEQHSAAWIWGAQSQPPARHEVCADITSRARPAVGALLAVREVVLLHEDTVPIGGILVTTPMRTAIDLARFVAGWDEHEERIVRTLLEICDCSILDCARVMNRKRNLPNKRIALERLSGCAGDLSS
jgi:AbiEi antitoxin C-terminal domain